MTAINASSMDGPAYLEPAITLQERISEVDQEEEITQGAKGREQSNYCGMRLAVAGLAGIRER